MNKTVKKQNQKDSLSLKNLTSFARTSEEQRLKVKEKIKDYKEKYGDDYWEYLLQDEGYMKDYDTRKQHINTAIYNREWIKVSGQGEWAATCRIEQTERIKELFGKDCDIDAIFSDASIDIGKVLLAEARRTKKWQELPEVLKPKYKELNDKK